VAPYQNTIGFNASGVSAGLTLIVKYENYRGCSTPVVYGGNGNTIPLEPVSPAELPSVNSFAKQKNFYLRFNNCAAGQVFITYQIQSTSGSSANGAQGLLGQAGSAGGVTVQVLYLNNQSQYTPVSLGTSYTATKVSGWSWGDYYFAVRYYRTGSLSPGNVAAQMKMTIQYS